MAAGVAGAVAAAPGWPAKAVSGVAGLDWLGFFIFVIGAVDGCSHFLPKVSKFGVG